MINLKDFEGKVLKRIVEDKDEYICLFFADGSKIEIRAELYNWDQPGLEVDAHA
jgi:hypothetical protein